MLMCICVCDYIYISRMDREMACSLISILLLCELALKQIGGKKSL